MNCRNSPAIQPSKIPCLLSAPRPQLMKPSESKVPWDYFNELRTIPASKAFRPLDEGGCPLVNQAATAR